MKIEKIKPIPKYMVEKIKKLDKKICPERSGQVRFYSYLTTNDKELVKVTVAVKHHYSKWYYKQVAVHGLDSEICFVKDMGYFWMGGYVVGWFEEGLQKVQKYYEDGKWYPADRKYFEPYSVLLNKEYIAKFPEFKYSGYQLYNNPNILKFLRNYRAYPQAEFLIKMGLTEFIYSKQILNLIAKDKPFRKWLWKNRDDIKCRDYYVSAIITAYKQNKSVEEIHKFEMTKKAFQSQYNFREIKELFKGELNKFFEYIARQRTDASSYRDYLIACNYLGLDMTLDKNRLPHDFKRWHDIRIDEYHTAKAIKDEEQRRELFAKFLTVAEKYLSLEKADKSAYIAIIAKSPSELIQEGETLHHCVGRMNYDQKFVREESLIFFIRSSSAAETPFVTVEYSITKRKILQCYGEHNSKPEPEVLQYITKKWLPYANRQLKKLAA